MERGGTPKSQGRSAVLTRFKSRRGLARHGPANSLSARTGAMPRFGPTQSQSSRGLWWSDSGGSSSSSTTSTQTESKLLTQDRGHVVAGQARRHHEVDAGFRAAALRRPGAGPGAAQHLQRHGLRARWSATSRASASRPATTKSLPSLAESWEFSPDKTTITFKLRQGVKWHNMAPVNGRAFDSADVVATWKRYVGLPQQQPRRQLQLDQPERADHVGHGAGRQDGRLQAQGAGLVHHAAPRQHDYGRGRHHLPEGGRRTASTRARTRSAPAASCSTSTSRRSA